MSEVILTMTGKRFGCVGLVDAQGSWPASSPMATCAGTGPRMQDRRPAEIMTRSPRTAPLGSLASAALETMNRMKITVLFILDDGKPAGILHIHDLLRAGVA